MCGLTHQSSGHAPASRVMPLISNVRHHKYNGLSAFKKLSGSQSTLETLNSFPQPLGLSQRKYCLLSCCCDPNDRAGSERRFTVSVLKSFEVSQWGHWPGSRARRTSQRQRRLPDQRQEQELNQAVGPLPYRLCSNRAVRTLVAPSQVQRLHLSAQVGHLGLHHRDA